MNPIDIVQAALEDLPGTPDNIAAKFEANGIYGHVGAASACPVTRYLNQRLQTAGVEKVHVATVGPYVAVNVFSAEMAKWTRTVVDVPDRVAVFARRFDEGKYPELKETFIRRQVVKNESG